MKIVRHIIVALLVCCSVQQSTAQYKQCVDKVVGYIDGMIAFTKKSNQTSYMKYTTTTLFHEKQNTPRSTTTTEVFVGGNTYMLKDPNMKVFSDLKYTFVVVESNKLIYWNNSDPTMFKQNNAYTIFLELEKKMLETSKVDCELTKETMILTIIPPTEILNKIHLTKQEIVFNKKLNRIESVTNHYNAKGKMKMQRVDYQDIAYNTNKKMNTTSQEYLFNSGQLKPEYKTYTLIDNRTK